jgi:NitT/TauT family transport system permease protein
MPPVVEKVEEVTGSIPVPRVQQQPKPGRSWFECARVLLFPFAAVVALIVHPRVSLNELPNQTSLYTRFLEIIVTASMLALVSRFVFKPSRRWLDHMGPILGAATAALCIWEVITAGMHLLPMPYFPPPAGVLFGLVDDRQVLLEGTLSSLWLLARGYAIGVLLSLITGICIGWFSTARYWGMPLLKIIGPIPATAWIPLAMVVSKDPGYSAVGLIALAVWFPVTMLTASGISNTKASYLDVARTLGAGRTYLIFKVAVPAAMPSIFIGLFMGLGSSFLTLVVAESVGVRSGLGYYLTWKQGWAEYGKVYAALVIMAAFFSTIMTLLFKVRDRVLVWQKGTIKW